MSETKTTTEAAGSPARTGSAVLPCPCCGGEAVTRTTPDWRTDDQLLAYVICRLCGLQTALRSTTEEALNAWNLRVPPNAPRSATPEDGR